MLFYWLPWWPITITGVIKRISFIYFITFKSIYIKYVNSGPKPKSIISHDWCDVLGIYFSSYFMWQFSTYFEDKRMLESVGINTIQDSLDWVESQMDSNTIYYFKFQTWNLDLQPVYNRCKLTIQLVWCSNTRPCKTFSNPIYKLQNNNTFYI